MAVHKMYRECTVKMYRTTRDLEELKDQNRRGTDAFTRVLTIPVRGGGGFEEVNIIHISHMVYYTEAAFDNLTGQNLV